VDYPIAKSVLTEPQARLVGLLQQINFGRIEGLQVRGGMPVFEPPPRIVQKLKMGGDNAPRPEAALADFLLKRQTIDLLDVVAKLGDGEIRTIEVHHGLALMVEVERQPDFHDPGCADA
jgi:hypothetical protein